MQKINHLGFQQAAAISLNYALDSIETVILKELRSGTQVSDETLHRILLVVKKQRIEISHLHASPLQ